MDPDCDCLDLFLEDLELEIESQDDVCRRCGRKRPKLSIAAARAALFNDDPDPPLPSQPAEPVAEEVARQLEAVATHFRSTLESADKESLPEPFRAFPHGSCDVASQALGVRIRETLGLVCLVRANGTRYRPEGNTQSHAWLVYGDLIIDVTADQFGEGQEPVMVTRNSSWHKEFADTGGTQPIDDSDWFTEWCEPALALVRAKPM